MVEYEVADVVAIHLDGQPSPDSGPAPYGASMPGIADALGMDGATVANRISLLSALSTLQSRDWVTERVGSVRGLPGERNIYELTESGSEAVASLRSDLRTAEITVHGEGTETVALGAIDGYADHFDGEPLVCALSRLTDDDVLYLEEATGSGIVGRSESLETVEETLDAVAAGQSRRLLLTGEVGTGKTTLLEELERRADDRGFGTVVGRCERDGGGPYGPFRPLLAELDVLDDDGSLEPSDAEGFAANRRALFHDVATAIDEWVDGEPVAVLIDDLQWAGRPTIELFASLATDAVVDSLLLVGTARPEAATGDHPLATALAGDPEYTRLDLGPFDRAATRELVVGLVGDRDVPSSFVDQLYETTGGNPLFVAESVRQLLEAGAVDPVHGVYPDGSDEIGVPDRVQSAIERRLSGLDDDGRAVLEAGAVVGETIPFPVLSRVVDVSEPDCREYVDLLVGSAIWQYRADALPDGGATTPDASGAAPPTGTPDGIADSGPLSSVDAPEASVLSFTSGAIRSAVLSGMDPERRARLHRRVADALASIVDDPGVEAGSIAAHYDAAGADREAIEYYRLAGDRAEDVYAHETAIEAYESAVALARDLDDDEGTETVRELLTATAEAHRVLGNHDEATRTLEYLLERTTDPVEQQRLYHEIAEVRNDDGDYEAAVEYARAGLELSDPEDAPTAETITLLIVEGWGHLWQQAFDRARERFEAAIEEAAAIDADREHARALYGLGSTLMSMDRIEQAEPILERAVERNAAVGRTQTHIYALNDLGIVRSKQGDLDAAEALYEECYELRREYGDVQGECTSCIALGVLANTRGETEQAMTYYQRGLEIAERIGDHDRAGLLENNMAVVHLYGGNFDAALERSRGGYLRHAQHGHSHKLALHYGVRTTVAYYRGAFDRAAAFARWQRALGREHDDDVQVVLTRNVLGEIARLRGDFDAARGHHTEALELAETNGNAVRTQQSRTLLIWALTEAGALDAAREQVDRIPDPAELTPGERAEPWAALGCFYRRTGDPERATEILERELENRREAGERVGVVVLTDELARTALARGDDEAARAHATACLSTAREHEVELYVDRCATLRDRLE